MRCYTDYTNIRLGYNLTLERIFFSKASPPHKSHPDNKYVFF